MWWKTGLCVRIMFHDGQLKTMQAVVAEAVSPEYQEKGHVIVVDNYYVTGAVIQWILEEKMHLLGTIQSNRIPIANWVLSPSASRGTMRVIEVKKGEKGLICFPTLECLLLFLILSSVQLCFLE